MSKKKPTGRKKMVSKKTDLNKRVKNIIANFGERKYRDLVNSSPVNIDDTGFTSGLSDIPQGDTDITRDGDKIRGLSVEIGFELHHSGTANSIETVRVIVFRWKPFFDTDPPTTSDIFTSTAFNYSAVGQLNHDQRGQFNVLWDRAFTLDLTSVRAVHVIRRIGLAKKLISYKAGSTTAVSGGIYISFISTKAGGGGVYPTVAFGSYRLNYNDS